MTTKYTVLSIYREILDKFMEEGVDMGSFVLSKANRENQLNTSVTSGIIKEVLSSHEKKCMINHTEYMQQIRMLNDTFRYYLDGKLRIVALLLNELLPKRLDYRNTPRPCLNASNTDKTVSSEDSLLPLLKDESVDYISYLVRMSTNSDDYSAKLPISEYKTVFQDLESICTMWQLDPSENKAEMLYCRLLAEVNEQGVPIQLTNSSDEKTMVLREIIPVVHAIARYRRASHSPFYKFVNMLPTVLVDYLGSGHLSIWGADMAMDLLNDVIAFNTELKENSDKASQFLSRFHHGHPLYIDMIHVLKVQHTLMMTTGSDLMRRFGLFIITAGKEETPIPDSLNLFLNETRIAHVYRTQQNINYVAP